MCLTTAILAPGASEGGLGAAALAPLWGECRDPGIRGWTPRGHFFCAGCGPESQKLGIGWPCLTNIHKYFKIWSKTTQNVKVSKKGSFSILKNPRRAPATAMGGIFLKKWGPKGSHRVRCSYPEENIVLISEESNGFLSITEKLINYKENWKLRFSPKMQNHLQISS